MNRCLKMFFFFLLSATLAFHLEAMINTIHPVKGLQKDVLGCLVISTQNANKQDIKEEFHSGNFTDLISKEKS